MLPFWVRVNLGAMAVKRITTFPRARVAPSDYLMSYLGQSLACVGGSYLSTKMQSVYSTVSADWERYESNYSPSSNGQIVGQTEFFSLMEASSLGEGKL